MKENRLNQELIIIIRLAKCMSHEIYTTSEPSLSFNFQFIFRKFSLELPETMRIFITLNRGRKNICCMSVASISISHTGPHAPVLENCLPCQSI